MAGSTLVGLHRNGMLSSVYRCTDRVQGLGFRHCFFYGSFVGGFRCPTGYVRMLAKFLWDMLLQPQTLYHIPYALNPKPHATP